MKPGLPRSVILRYVPDTIILCFWLAAQALETFRWSTTEALISPPRVNTQLVIEGRWTRGPLPSIRTWRACSTSMTERRPQASTGGASCEAIPRNEIANNPRAPNARLLTYPPTRSAGTSPGDSRFASSYRGFLAPTDPDPLWADAWINCSVRPALEQNKTIRSSCIAKSCGSVFESCCLGGWAIRE